MYMYVYSSLFFFSHRKCCNLLRDVPLKQPIKRTSGQIEERVDKCMYSVQYVHVINPSVHTVGGGYTYMYIHITVLCS